MTAVSNNYRKIDLDEARRVSVELADAWKDDAIPIRQFELAVKKELEILRLGELREPYAALVRCLRRLPVGLNHSGTHLLDAGAASGYYGEVLKLSGFEFSYNAMDFSPAFKDLAMNLYPGIKFIVADASNIPCLDKVYDIVLTGAVMMHCLEYEKVFAEAVRVSNKYIILHRTPVLTEQPTTYFVKDAYGIPCVEIHFNESELFELFVKYDVSVIWQDDIFRDASGMFGHRNYVLIKND